MAQKLETVDEAMARITAALDAVRGTPEPWVITRTATDRLAVGQLLQMAVKRDLFWVPITHNSEALAETVADAQRGAATEKARLAPRPVGWLMTDQDTAMTMAAIRDMLPTEDVTELNEQVLELEQQTCEAAIRFVTEGNDEWLQQTTKALIAARKALADASA